MKRGWAYIIEIRKATSHGFGEALPRVFNISKGGKAIAPSCVRIVIREPRTRTWSQLRLDASHPSISRCTTHLKRVPSPREKRTVCPRQWHRPCRPYYLHGGSCPRSFATSSPLDVGPSADSMHDSMCWSASAALRGLGAVQNRTRSSSASAPAFHLISAGYSSFLPSHILKRYRAR